MYLLYSAHEVASAHSANHLENYPFIPFPVTQFPVIRLKFHSLTNRLYVLLLYHISLSIFRTSQNHNTMPTLSAMNAILYISLTLASFSGATRYTNTPATLTTPPSIATLEARVLNKVVNPKIGQVTNGPCGLFDRWEVVGAGQTCSSLADKYKITVVDLKTMNPGIEAHCDNLNATSSYCIGAHGSQDKIPLSCTLT